MASPSKKKILKNTTASPIVLDQIGLTVPALGQITIEPGRYYTIANEIGLTPTGALDNFILNGQIVVNDGVRDLKVSNGVSLDRAIDYLKWPDTAFNIRFLAEPERSNGFVSKNVQEAIEEVRVAIEGKIAALPTFLNNGNTNNKWLSLDGSFSASDTAPAIVLYDSSVVGLTYINDSNGSNLDVELYKNGTSPGNLIFTWQIRNKRHAYKSNINITGLVRGDRLSCFVRGVSGTNPNSVLVNTFVQAISSTVGEGGNSSGIT